VLVLVRVSVMVPARELVPAWVLALVMVPVLARELVPEPAPVLAQHRQWPVSQRSITAPACLAIFFCSLPYLLSDITIP
jgi:hypothetical protein